MHPFREYISKFCFISQEDWDKIESKITLNEYNKDISILEEGKICNKLYFIENGLIRFYTISDGEEISKFFTLAPYCFTSQRSFTEQIPSKEGIKTIEASRIWEMNRNDAFELLTIQSWSEFIRKLTQEVQFNTETILEQLQKETAENRYKNMLESQNELISRVPLKDLAPFFGIAPSSLSRVRKKISTQNRT